MTGSVAVPSSSRLPVLLLTAICCAYSVWVLSLPVFPTQDGPVHLYLAHVLQSVMMHPASPYSRFYFVRHVLPPYALYYYALIALGRVVPLVVADRLIVCAYFFLFGFGLRYLARVIGPNGDLIALLGTVLLLNWPLGMGFINFCLSTGLALWALGLWCRAAQDQGWGRRVGFVALCGVMMLTHPVPLLAVLAFVGLDLLVRLLRERAMHPLVRDILTVCAASATLIYIRLFTSGHVTQQVHRTVEPFWRMELHLWQGYLLLHTLVAFAGRSPADVAYRSMFYALFAGCFAVAMRNVSMDWRQRNGTGRRAWRLADTWTLAAMGLVVVFPFLPPDLNGSAYFSARLVLFVWIAALAAAAGAQVAGRRVRFGVMLASTLAAALTLGLAEARIRPIARTIAALDTSPSLRAYTVGLFLHDPGYTAPSAVTYDPYFWAGVHLFRRTDAVLGNTPWLDLAIMPLGPRPTLPASALSPSELESPQELRVQMEADAATRDAVLSREQFALFSAGGRPLSTMRDPLLPSLPGGGGWSCQDVAGSRLCTAPHR